MGDHDDSDDAQHTRRSTGARTPVSDPVVFRQGDRTIEGWALNISTGGLRAILDEAIARDEELEVVIGDGSARPARVVWLRKERGGAIVGIAFSDVDEPNAPPDDDL